MAIDLPDIDGSPRLTQQVLDLIDTRLDNIESGGASNGNGGEANTVSILGNASYALSGHRAVTRLANGSFIYGTNTDESQHTSLFAITTGAVANGALVDATVYGVVFEPSWRWTPGPVFLGADGALVQEPPAKPSAKFLVQLGIAISTTQLFVNQYPAISLA